VPFAKCSVVDELEAQLGGLLPLEQEADEAKRHLLQMSSKRGFNFVTAEMSLARIYDKLISKLLEPRYIHPTFLVGHPMTLSPLAKSRPENHLVADRFELFIGGSELANGFSEQNDPDIQMSAFIEQSKAKAQGDAEAQCLDEDFVQVLEAGLPPTGGCGIGIDRLVMYLTGKKHIRDVLSYPMIRSRNI
jgi:lysyl-tRNA synthetase class 2